MYVSLLTSSQKDKKIPQIIARDGDVCFFCKIPFIPEVRKWRRTIDHANNNPKDNRVENLLIVHLECNEQKKYNLDYHILAQDAEKENTIQAESLSESEREKHTRKDKDVDELDEGDINLIVNKLVKTELESKLPDGDFESIISYRETLKGIHYLLQQQTGGRGSEPASRRSLDAHCSQYSPWLDEKLGRGNRIIRRRKPDEL